MATELGGGGEIVAVAKRPKASDDATAAEDCLSALPDDVLVLILLHLYTRDAVRTSALSRRWRKVWTLLPELLFPFVRDSRCVAAALAASEVPLRYLLIGDRNPSPESLAAWLPAAARRITGELLLWNFGRARTAADGEAGAGAEEDNVFELPFFDKATSIWIDMGSLGVSVPPAGVFARLTNLSLTGGRFHGPGDLGDAVSSPRCPCLQKLAIRYVQGVDTIAIVSETLQQLDLDGLRGVRQVTVVAPTLKSFGLLQCFIDVYDPVQPVASIEAPQLKSLKWVDSYDPTSVHLATMEHLHAMVTFFFVYGPDGFTHNRACLELLPRFKVVERLVLSLSYLQELDHLEYLMKDMTTLPHVASLHLIVLAKGHSIGPCSFHVLRICSGIKHLVLVLSNLCDSEEPSACASDCICDQPENWKTEDISLNNLQELEIEGFRASDHEVAFVNRLLNWVPALKMLTVTLNPSINESKAKELFQMFSGFSRPGVCMQFFNYKKFIKVLFSPKDKLSGGHSTSMPI